MTRFAPTLPLAFVVFSSAALAQSTIADFQGTGALSRFGFSTASVGDWNHDGYDDFAVGATQDGALMNGSVTVFSGRTGSVLFHYSGSNYERSGWSLAGPGDTNNDGFTDIAVGSVQFPTTPTPPNGAVRVFSGKAGGLLWIKTGGFKHLLGISLSAVGDLNGDGVSDLIAGSGVKYALALSGADGAQLLNLSDANAAFGRVTGAAGDVNLDGTPDFLIGAAGSFVRLYSGASGGLLYQWNTLGADTFGASATGVGDINSDGVPDIGIGAPGDDTSGPDFGAVHIYSGADGSFIYAISGASAGGFGSTIAALGDMNAGGVPDFTFAAPTESGLGAIRVQSGETVSTYVTFNGMPPADTASFGASLSNAGDVNADGFPEILAGAYLETTFGNAHLLSAVMAGTSPYGAGTAGCAGVQRIAAASVPFIGNTQFAIYGDAAPASSLGLLLIGNAQDLAGSDPFGIGVSLHVDLLQSTEVYAFDAVTGLSGAGGAAFAIPNNPLVAGFSYYAQFLWLWPSSQCVPSPLGLSSSRALILQIQP